MMIDTTKLHCDSSISDLDLDSVTDMRESKNFCVDYFMEWDGIWYAAEA